MKRKKLLVTLLISMILTLMIGCSGPTVKFGSIDINSTPAGARVYLNGVDTGMGTPIIFTKEVGNYAVKLNKFNYKIWEGTVTVNANQATYINPYLTWASTETVTLQPGSGGKDSDVNIYSPNIPNGNDTTLLIGYYFSAAGIQSMLRTYLQFGLDNVPGNARIINANLKLNQYDQWGTGSFTAGLYQVTSGWEEDNITWENQPTSSSKVEASCTISAIATGSNVWRTWDNIGDLVQGWLDGSIINYGMLLKDTDEELNNMVAGFLSSNYNSVPSERPKLEVNYYIP